MAYLITSDYNRLIQDISLSQIISGNPLLKTQAELAAIPEIKSYLTAKYDVDAEFTDTTQYSNAAATYKAASRVYIDAVDYSTSATYAIGALVKLTNIYRCITAVVSPEAFDPAKWEVLGAQYDLFYAQYPKPVFNMNTAYLKDDQVFWKNKTYTALVPTRVIDHENFIQYNRVSDVPLSNVFPDDPINGAQFWGAGVAYTIPAGSILDTDYFTSGDNRNQQLVLYTIDVSIYHLYGRIPPQVVPELRLQRYYAVKEWLKSVAKSNDIVAAIRKLQPDQGNVIRGGSRPKLDNYYTLLILFLALNN